MSVSATNNVGLPDVASVTRRSRWAVGLSAVEVCGNITWFEDEFATEISLHTAGLDAVLNAEGTQYAYLSAAGVTGETGGQSAHWRSRTVAPLVRGTVPHIR